MAAAPIIALALGTSVVVGVWRRISYNLRSHARADKFERELRSARDQMTIETPWRAATEADRELVARLDLVAADQAALEACGFTVAGDLVGMGANRVAILVVRALVDPTGTICASASVARGSDKTSIGLASFSPDDMLSTQRGRQARLAEPPFVRRQTLAADVTHEQLVAKHRAVAGDDAALDRIASHHDLIAELLRIRARVIDWRNAQPPDELLDADLRNVLGDVYERSGKIWAHRLRDRLPEATLRRR